ncbi:hypothetical protein ACGFYA_27220 [Streptomyces sp. NPDC048305]
MRRHAAWPRHGVRAHPPRGGAKVEPLVTERLVAQGIEVTVYDHG